MLSVVAQVANTIALVVAAATGGAAYVAVPAVHIIRLFFFMPPLFFYCIPFSRFMCHAIVCPRWRGPMEASARHGNLDRPASPGLFSRNHSVSVKHTDMNRTNVQQTRNSSPGTPSPAGLGHQSTSGSCRTEPGLAAGLG